jgi:hypothetical protein
MFRPRTRPTNRALRVREVDLVGYRLPPGRRPPPVGFGFRLASLVDHQNLTFARYIARRPMLVSTMRLPALLSGSRSVLIEAGQRSPTQPR